MMALSDALQLKARITERACESLSLKKNMRVWALIKSVALSESGKS
jgi:ABC-type molybdate transport system ATPase subunit